MKLSSSLLGIDKTGFLRDELWKMTGDSLPEHQTFFFYLQRISNYRTLPRLFSRLSAEGDLTLLGLSAQSCLLLLRT